VILCCFPQILDGRIAVNGKLVTTLGARVDPKRDTLCVDGKKVGLGMVQQPHWVAVNKPKSVLTTARDGNNRETVVKLIPAADELRLVPVGGMDRSDTGLLLLTNEVDWIHPLTHPSFPHRDVYEVTASGAPSDHDLTSLPDETDSGTRAGTYKVELLDVDRRQGMCKLRVSMDHRRPRQLEDLIGNLGCTLVSSKRLEFAGIKLRGLKRGQWRELTPGEVATVKASAGKRTPDSPTEVPPTALVRGAVREREPTSLAWKRKFIRKGSEKVTADSGMQRVKRAVGRGERVSSATMKKFTTKGSGKMTADRGKDDYPTQLDKRAVRRGERGSSAPTKKFTRKGSGKMTTDSGVDVHPTQFVKQAVRRGERASSAPVRKFTRKGSGK
jgi:23S rRNA pseudouridine2605 synthase